jgi:phosphoribosyl 1,2-cyclic phosphodiesterase
MTDQIAVKFWGVRGSYPVAGPSALHFGGNTPCVEVRVGGHTLIFDTGTGVIALGRELARRSKQSGIPLSATVFFSHLHSDHTQGLPFFAPLRDPSCRLHMFSPAFLGEDAETALSTIMAPPAFPISWTEMPASKTMRTIHEDDTLLLGKSADDVVLINASDPPVYSADVGQVRSMYSAAHPGGVFFFRIDWHGLSVVYASDTEGGSQVDRRLARFARNADVLIHDAQYTDEHYSGRLEGMPSTRGWGHSTPEMACAVAQAANARQLILFHHEPTYDDDTLAAIEREARTQFGSTRVAYEGLELTLEHQPQLELQA